MKKPRKYQVIENKRRLKATMKNSWLVGGFFGQIEEFDQKHLQCTYEPC